MHGFSLDSEIICFSFEENLLKMISQNRGKGCDNAEH